MVNNSETTKLKILWITKKYFDVEVDRTTWIEMIKILQSRGHKILLLTGFRKTRNSYGLKGSIIYIPSIKIKFFHHLTFTFNIFFCLLFYLLKLKPHVVILDPFTVWVTLPFYLARKMGFINTKFVLDIRTLLYEDQRLKNLFFWVSLFYAKYFCEDMTFITPAMEAYIKKIVRLKEKEYGIWTSGVNTELFNPHSVDEKELAQLKRHFGIQDRFVVMHHGILSPERGILELIEAIHLVKKKNPQIALLLVGEGPLKKEINTKIKTLRLQKWVINTGVLPHEKIPTFIALADIGILPFPNKPSRITCSPIKLFEYLSMEKPVIVTDIQAHRDILGDKGIGIYIKTHEPSEIAKGILHALTLSPYELKNMGARGRDLVLNNYSWQKQADNLETYLLKLYNYKGGKHKR